ncbi:unnamed protein product [Mucor hiemalis]
MTKQTKLRVEKAYTTSRFTSIRGIGRTQSTLTSVFRPENRTVMSDITLQNLVTEITVEGSTTTKGSVTEGSTALVEEVTQEQTEISVRISVENLVEEPVDDPVEDLVEDAFEEDISDTLPDNSVLSKYFESVQARLTDEGYPSAF